MGQHRGMSHTPGYSVEVAARSARLMTDVDVIPQTLNREWALLTWAKKPLSRDFKEWRRRKLEERLSHEQRVTPDRRLKRALSAADKRRAEAEKWIAEVKARKPGIPVRSGIHSGDRIK